MQRTPTARHNRIPGVVSAGTRFPVDALVDAAGSAAREVLADPERLFIATILRLFAHEWYSLPDYHGHMIMIWIAM